MAVTLELLQAQSLLKAQISLSDGAGVKAMDPETSSGRRCIYLDMRFI